MAMAGVSLLIVAIVATAMPNEAAGGLRGGAAGSTGVVDADGDARTATMTSTYLPGGPAGASAVRGGAAGSTGGLDADGEPRTATMTTNGGPPRRRQPPPRAPPRGNARQPGTSTAPPANSGRQQGPPRRRQPPPRAPPRGNARQRGTSTAPPGSGSPPQPWAASPSGNSGRQEGHPRRRHHHHPRPRAPPGTNSPEDHEPTPTSADRNGEKRESEKISPIFAGLLTAAGVSVFGLIVYCSVRPVSCLINCWRACIVSRAVAAGHQTYANTDDVEAAVRATANAATSCFGTAAKLVNMAANAARRL